MVQQFQCKEQCWKRQHADQGRQITSLQTQKCYAITGVTYGWSRLTLFRLMSEKHSLKATNLQWPPLKLLSQ